MANSISITKNILYNKEMTVGLLLKSNLKSINTTSIPTIIFWI